MLKYIFKSIIFISLLVSNFLVFGVEKKVDQKKIVFELLKSVETKDPKSIQNIDEKKFKENNYRVRDSIKGFNKIHKKLPNSPIKVNTIRVFEDKNFVFAHTDYIFKGPQVGIDIFRFENSKIVEHWGGLEQKVDKKNSTGNTQIDGSKEIKDLKKTDANKKIILEYIQTVLINQKISSIKKWIDPKNYIQHSAIIENEFSISKKNIKYNDIDNILGEGNFVLAISQGDMACEEYTFYDLFRLDKGKIVEHWDVIQKMTHEF
ncbi:hypothetical protein QEJ31_01470 [Pigmentibacter sp. JX0631]|uniref:nuclear transport factor 2 family protein n=1 Tax=Pigmentibacter sp. JX0631 TaxID=2976982 RepID=UPI002469AB04|nr:hypothetical protein [Pigmentibacter sp. JX0631]WGL60274.1 hypothetical protein QEJ31_01470 [Pigmentibacter sp. JX0631]